MEKHFYHLFIQMIPDTNFLKLFVLKGDFGSARLSHSGAIIRSLFVS